MKPLVGIIMGSQSDWETMQHASTTLESFGIAHEVKVVSAHRTPDLLHEYAESAVTRGLQVVIAGAGGAAHLPGMSAAKTRLPVLGVPIESKALKGMDSLLSIVQMPAGVPVGSRIRPTRYWRTAILAVSEEDWHHRRRSAWPDAGFRRAASRYRVCLPGSIT